MTQTQLAGEVGIRQNMVSDYEHGRRTYSDAMAKSLSAVLRVKEQILRYGCEPGDTPNPR
jgi:transcriptional regulator with XRE-family HTH domain